MPFNFLKTTLILLMSFTSLTLAKPSNKLLRIGITQEFENLNPLIKQMVATHYIADMVVRRLVIISPEGEWSPQLVKQVPSLENGLAKIVEQKGKDGKKIKKIVANWELKEGVKWGDGTPLTGYDVKFSWEIASTDSVPVGEKKVYTQVEKIDVDPKNPRKFTFTYENAKWNFHHLGTFEIVPKHIEGPIFKKHSKDAGGYSKNSEYVRNPLNPGLYNGPYVIKDLKLGSHVLLERNPHFYDKPAHIEKIVIKLIPNTGTLESNLRSGSIDMISALGFTLDQAIKFEKSSKKEKLPYQVNFVPGLIYEHIDLQLANPLLQDVRVRKALVYSIDREKLVMAMFEGKQEVALHNLAPSDPWFTRDYSKIVVYKHSKRVAKKLLKEAGWKVNKKDGYRYKNGKKLSFEFMTTSGNKLREMVQVFLQNEWKKVGVEITIKNEPPRVYFGQTMRQSKFKAMGMYAWMSSPENNPRAGLHSESIPSEKNGYSGQNRPRWVNKEVDKLIEQVDVTFDHKERTNLSHKILYHYTNEVPVIPLYYRSQISVTPKGLKGYKLVPHQYSSGNHVEHWHF